MDRDKMVTRLLWQREMRLRQEIGQLKQHTASLARSQELRDEACAAADDHLGDLRDRGAIGAIRLDATRAALAAAAEVRAAGDRVNQARKRADAAQTVRTRLRQARRLDRDRSQEKEADEFHGWKRGLAPRA